MPADPADRPGLTDEGDEPLVDIGLNLLNAAFDADRQQVAERAVAAGVAHMVMTGTDIPSSQACATHAALNPPRFSCTAGVHPHASADLPPGWLASLEALLQQPPVRAIGETGLDFNRNYSPRPAQERCFIAQIELARSVGLPLFVHDRDTDGRVVQLLDRYAGALPAVVMHCFTGNANDLAAALERGFHIGITGWVCDERRGQPLADLIPQIPGDRLMIETDAPFLTPRTMPGHRRLRRNEPAFLIWVARRIAALRGYSVNATISDSTTTAVRFFGLKALSPLPPPPPTPPGQSSEPAVA